jgi:uncharacterized membrane protein
MRRKRFGGLAIAIGLALAAACTESATRNPGGQSGAGGGGGTTGGAGMTGDASMTGDADVTGDADITGGADVTGGAGGAGGMSTEATGDVGTPPPAILLDVVPEVISRDGAVVAGRDPKDTTFAMRWTATTGAVRLWQARITALSADGATVIGEMTMPSGRPRAVCWVRDVPKEIGFPRPTDTFTTPIGVSADGTFVVGNAWSTSPTVTSVEAFRWTAAHGSEGLGFLPGDSASEAHAMSPDGETIVGFSFNQAKQKAHAFRWSKATGMVELPDLPNSTLVVPVAVSDGGTAILGDAFRGEASFSNVVPTSRDAIVWMGDTPRPIVGCTVGFSYALAIGTQWPVFVGACTGSASTGFKETPFIAGPDLNAHLLTPPAAYPDSARPVGVSLDGNVVVAHVSRDGLGGSQPAFSVWLNQAPQPTLVAKRIFGPGGVPLDYLIVTALSEDGSTIVGSAQNPAGDGAIGWRLRLR